MHLSQNQGKSGLNSPGFVNLLKPKQLLCDALLQPSQIIISSLPKYVFGSRQTSQTISLSISFA